MELATLLANATVIQASLGVTVARLGIVLTNVMHHTEIAYRINACVLTGILEMTVAVLVLKSRDRCVRATGLVSLGFVFAINIGFRQTAPSARTPRPVVPEKVAIMKEPVYVPMGFLVTTATLMAL